VVPVGRGPHAGRSCRRQGRGCAAVGALAPTRGARVPRLAKLPAAALDHLRCWDAMHAVDTAALVEAERAITATMVAEY